MTAFQSVQYASSSSSFSPYPVSYTYQCDKACQTVKFECQHCDSVLSSKALLRQHELVHRIIYDCVWTPACSHRFTTKSDFKQHMNAHTAERFLPCAYCPKSCDNQDHYKNHVKKHVEKPLFTCRYCPSKFDQRALLRNHERAHNNVKFVHLYKPHTVSELKKIVAKSMKKVRKSFTPEIQRCRKLKNVIPMETDSDSTSGRPTDTESSDGNQNNREPPHGNQNQNDREPPHGDQNQNHREPPHRNQKQNDTESPRTRAAVRQAEEKRRSEITSTECTNSAFFRCTVCKYSSNHFRSYENHKAIHARKKGEFICKICYAPFSRKIWLNKHETSCH